MEYVLKLAEWIRKNLPEVNDDHLFNIETAVRAKIDQRNLCLTSLMGDTHQNQEGLQAQAVEQEAAVAESVENGNGNCDEKSSSCVFSTQLRPKCLRCTKV